MTKPTALLTIAKSQFQLPSKSLALHPLPT
jgi:hypothetical protein